MIFRLTIGLILLVGSIIVLLNSSLDKVEYDESAVITNIILGTTRVQQSGAFVKLPWDEVQIYKVSQDLLELNFPVTDKENKSFKITVSIRSFLNRDQIDKLHKRYGKNYKSMLDSLSALAIRVTTKKFKALEIYSSKRVEAEIELAGNLREMFENNFIHFDSSLIQSVELPEDK